MAQIRLSENLILLNSATIDTFKKVAIAKEISKSLSCDEERLGEASIQSTFESISRLYFQLDFRDPLKRTLKRLLQDLETNILTLEAYLCNSFNYTSSPDIKLGCENIISCLDCFPLGAQAVLTSQEKVWSFLLCGLQFVQTKMLRFPSPQETTELFGICQSVFKATSLTLQELRRSGNIPTEHIATLVNVYDVVLDFLLMDSALLNSRLSAGITVANIFKTLFQDNIHTAVHSKVLQPDGVQHTIRNVYAMESSSFTFQLCAWGGLLASLTPAELINIEPTDGHCLIIQDVLPKILSIHREKEDPGIVLAHARTLFLWTEKATEALKNCNPNEEFRQQMSGTSFVGKELFSYIWSVWDHFMDGVRYHAMAIFQNVVGLHLQSSKEDPVESPFLRAMCKRLLSLPWHQKGKYGALSHLALYMGAQRLLLSEPLLVELMVEALTEGGLATHVSELACVLYSQHLKEVDFPQWQQVWLEPLLSGLALGTKQQRSSIQQHILPKLYKCEPRALQYFVQRLSDRAFIGKESSLIVLMSCMKTAKSSKVSFTSLLKDDHGDIHTLWKNCLPYSVLQSALGHRDEQVRLDALGLICDSPKTSEAFTPEELRLIQFFLQYNINVQSPSFRQKMMGYFKKFLHRICDSSHLVLKKLKQLNSKPRTESELVKSYQTFIQWLWSFLFSCLHPEANFPRRGSSLQIIVLISDIIGLRPKPCSNISEDYRGLSPDVSALECQTVLECLRDTYENNKQLALQFLSKLPSDLLGLQDKPKLLYLLKVSLQLASSTRPPDCITAAYLLQVIASHSQADLLIACLEESFEVVGKCEKTTPLRVHHTLVSVLTRRLESELRVAGVNLLAAAAGGPMYGLLSCIRYLLSQATPSLREVNDNSDWQSLVESLVDVSMHVTAVVQPVVCNASPEGHLPMDTHPESLLQLQATIQHAIGRRFLNAVVVPPGNHPTSDSKITSPTKPGNDSLKVDFVKTRAVTAQMLLLCSWRAHKEVSLLLGHLCQHLKIQGEKSVGLISRKQILDMGEFYIQQLSEIKHRGAFEEAYVGFCKLCHRLWRCPDASLHELPQLWLRDLLSVIASANDDAMCLTRRSAGLPFIVQALLISEPEGANGECFKEAMTTLLSLAIPEKIQQKSFATKAQVHALNILRALYREAHLGEEVMPYVAGGIKAAILGFKGDTWMLRNAATLLLTTLVTRIFGVNRSRDSHLQRKNCMTGRVFFQRFPSLFPFLLQELQEADLSLHHVGNLYPILLLLSRLYPSPMEGSDSQLQLGAFRPHVERCSRSPLHWTRGLAARALLPLLPLEQMSECLDRMFGSLTYGALHNHLHGLLLQITSVLEDLSAFPAELNVVIKFRIEEWISQSMWMLSDQNHCSLTKVAYLDLIWSILVAGFHPPSCISETVQSRALLEDSSILIGQDYLHATVSKIALATILTSCTESSCSSLTQTILYLLRNCYEVRMVTYDFLGWLFACGDECLQGRSLDLVPLKERHPWSNVPACLQNRTAVAQELNSSSTLYNHLWDFLSEETHPWCRTEIFFILSAITASWVKIGLNTSILIEKNLKDLICGIEENKFEDEAVAMIYLSANLISMLLKTNFKNAIANSELLGLWVSTVLDCCHPEGSTARRLAAAKSLVVCLPILTDSSFDHQWTVIVGPLWDSAVMLLQDDEPDIRESLECLPQMFRNCENSHKGISSLMLDMVIKEMLDSWSAVRPLHCLALLFDWILRTDSLSELGTIQGDEQPFDKGELNVFAEEVHLASLSCKHLSRLLSSVPGVNANTELPNLPWTSLGKTSGIQFVSVGFVLQRCLDELRTQVEEFAQCTLESVFLCHLFDSLCIKMFQRARVLQSVLEQVSVPPVAKSSDWDFIINGLQKWPYRNNFIDSILGTLVTTRKVCS